MVEDMVETVDNIVAYDNQPSKGRIMQEATCEGIM
jgi:hypothetical protein